MRNRLVTSSPGQPTSEYESNADDEVKFEFAIIRQSDYEFLGAESFEWSLHGGEELIIPLRIVFMSGGLYNLQSVRLTIISKDEKVPFLFPLQWIVQVEDSSRGNKS